jgi:DNA-binding transcriptional regulator YiaG
MTGAELRALLARAGLTQSGTARLMGTDPRTLRRWIADEREIPKTAVRLLFLLEHLPAVREALNWSDDDGPPA